MTDKEEKTTKKKKSETALWRSTVRITDSGLYERLKFLETQKGISIPKAINDSLFYGLEAYIKDVYGEIEIEETDNGDTIIRPKPNVSAVQEEWYYKIQETLNEIVNLLNEIVLNTMISKIIVSSLFNERVKNLYGYSVRPELLENGGLQDTPEFLSNHEKMVMDRIKKSRGRK